MEVSVPVEPSVTPLLRTRRGVEHTRVLCVSWRMGKRSQGLNRSPWVPRTSRPFWDLNFYFNPVNLLPRRPVPGSRLTGWFRLHPHPIAAEGPLDVFASRGEKR